MSDILWQILLLGAAGLVLAVVLPARSRLRGRSYNPLAQPDSSTGSEPLQSGGDGGGVAEVNPQKKFISDCLRRGRRPTPLEVLPLIKKLERENWPVPSVQDVLDEFDQRRAAIAQRKAQGSVSNQGSAVETEAGLVITRNGQPLVEQGSTRPAITDMAVNTSVALRQLPKTLPTLPDSPTNAIPFFYDGNQWFFHRPGFDGHWGIFGISGGGKGNLLQLIGLNALFMGPDEIELVVIDGKDGLDYSFCNRIQHSRLYYDQQITDGCLYVVDKVHRRNEFLRQHDCRNALEYRKLTGKTLPWLVVIADEIADFQQEQRAFIETFARLSRAAGGVLFVATQYPTADILGSQIQANVTNRVVFRLASSEYIKVALRRQRNDGGKYDPSLITKDMPGVAVWRADGGEVLGRTPEITDQRRLELIEELSYRWPKAVSSEEPVPRKIRQFERGTNGNLELIPNFGTELGAEPEPNKQKQEEKAIRDLANSGWSRNQIASFLGGRRQDRLDQIRKALEGDAV